MDAAKVNPEELLDRLNQITSVRGFLVEAVNTIEASMDDLIRASFTKGNIPFRAPTEPENAPRT